MDKTSKKLILSLIFLLIIMLTACHSITEEEAVRITQEFVNKQVKFYVNENNETPSIDRAQITVMETSKKEGIWSVYLHIASNSTGELKQNLIVVAVDAKNGNILGLDKVDTGQVR